MSGWMPFCVVFCFDFAHFWQFTCHSPCADESIRVLLLIDLYLPIFLVVTYQLTPTFLICCIRGWHPKWMEYGCNSIGVNRAQSERPLFADREMLKWRCLAGCIGVKVPQSNNGNVAGLSSPITASSITKVIKLACVRVTANQIKY